MIFDTHCHLYDDPFTDLKDVIKRAQDNKVELMLIPSDNIINSKKSIDLASKYSFIYSAIGIFPGEVYNLDLSCLEEIEKLAQNKKVKAIGEIGLDYHYYQDNKEKQKIFFIKQIELANKLHLPIIVHSRDACEDTLAVLDENKPLYGCVFHCFSYSVEVMKILMKRGYYIGLDGPVTYKNASTPKQVAKEVDINRLLVETDSPYLTPTPHRGERNEPARIIYTIQEIALLRNMFYDDVCKITYENGRKFFSI